MMIPYIAGMSDDIRSVCRKFDVRVVFKSGWTLRSMLTRVKDTLPVGKQFNMVYRISPEAVAKFTLGRPNGDWRPD